MARCHTRGSDVAAPGPFGPVSLGANKKLRGCGGGVKRGRRPMATIRLFGRACGHESAGQATLLPSEMRCRSRVEGCPDVSAATAVTRPTESQAQEVLDPDG